MMGRRASALVLVVVGLCAGVQPVLARLSTATPLSDKSISLDGLKDGAEQLINKFSTEWHHELEAISDFAVEALDRSTINEHHPFGHHVRIKFDGFGHRFDLALKLHEKVVHEKGVTRFKDPETGELTERKPVPRAFAGHVGHRQNWVRAVVLRTGEVRLAFKWNDEVHFVQPPRFHGASIDKPIRRLLTKLKVGMLGNRHWDKVHKDEHWHFFRGAMKLSGANMTARALSTATSGGKAAPQPQGNLRRGSEDATDVRKFDEARTRKLGDATMPSVLNSIITDTETPYGTMDSDCPSTMKYLEFAMAVDTGYTKSMTGYDTWDTSLSASDAVDDAEADAQWHVDVINVLYTDQANVFLSLSEIDVRYETDSDDWNQEPADVDALASDLDKDADGCPVWTDASDTDDSPGDLLDYFTTWFRQLSSPPGLYHLMTACFPPAGTVGLAYVGVTCNAWYGTGWTTWYPGGNFDTLAHEVGHNFGASHDFDDVGIMSYESVPEFTFKDQSAASICAHVSSEVDDCYSTFTATCGNGILEPGEECDDSTSCCDLTDCSLAAGAQCSTGTNSDCCTSSCQYEYSDTTCTIGQSTGYCVNGACRLSYTMSNGAWGYSETDSYYSCSKSNDPCVEYFVYGGTCYSSSLWSDGPYYVPEGAYCDANTVCDDSGSCSEAPPTMSPTVGGPTGTPSATPSAAPTFGPTMVVHPTPLPTLSFPPTKAPTDAPTFAPTLSFPPTLGPTLEPSFSATEFAVTTPSAGEFVYNEDTVRLIWSSDAPVTSTVSLYLLQAGDVVSTIDSAVTNVNYYDWTLSGHDPSHNYQVRVESDSGGVAGDSSYFTIEDHVSFNWTLPAPAWVEHVVYETGNNITVAWDYTGDVASVTVALLDASGAKQMAIVSDWTNLGYLDWVVPCSLAPGEYQLQITGEDGNQEVSVSTGNFTVQQGSNATSFGFVGMRDVTYVEAGNTARVLWTSPGTVDAVTLEMVNEHAGALAFANLTVVNGDNDNGVTFTVPANTTAGTLYRYSLASSDGAHQATSNLVTVVAAQPRVEVTDLFDGQVGELWRKGTNAKIDFTVTGPVDSVTIDLYNSTGHVATAVRYRTVVNTSTTHRYRVPCLGDPVPGYDYFIQVTSDLHPDVATTIYDVLFPIYNLGASYFLDSANDDAACTDDDATALSQEDSDYSLSVTKPGLGHTWDKGTDRLVAWEWDGDEPDDATVQVQLFKGNSSRRTIFGELCVPHYDASGVYHAACVNDPFDSSYEECATAVDANMLWTDGAVCVDFYRHFALIDSVDVDASSEEYLWTVAEHESALPEPGDNYVFRVVLREANRVYASSDTFQISYPAVLLTFGLDILVSELTNAVQEQLCEELATLLGILKSRVSISDYFSETSDDSRRRLSTTFTVVTVELGQSTEPTETSAESSAEEYIDLWSDTSSDLYTTGSYVSQTLDSTVYDASFEVVDTSETVDDDGSSGNDDDNTFELYLFAAGAVVIFAIGVSIGCILGCRGHRNRSAVANKEADCAIEVQETPIGRHLPSPTWNTHGSTNQETAVYDQSLRRVDRAF